MANKKKTYKQQIDKAIKARLREDMLKSNHFQRTKQKVEKSKKTYTRKNKKKPLQGDDE